MTVIKVDGKPNYDPCIFIITAAGSIYSESPAIGFIPRNDMDQDKLQDHLRSLRDEGFTITTRYI